ncbi:MAG: signal peptidase I [Bacteroidota bacterium]
MESRKTPQRFSSSSRKGKQPVDQKKPRTPKEKLVAFLKEVLYVGGAFLILNSFVLASFEVPTGSMEDTVMPGDFLFVNKFIFGGTTPRTIPLTNVRIPHVSLPKLRQVHKGDVIVFVWPGMPNEIRPPEPTYYLKRCVAEPGDTIQIINKVVFVNGIRQPLPKYAKFDRPYIIPKGVRDSRIFPPGSDYNEDNYGPLWVPKKGGTIKITPANLEQWQIFIEREGHTVDVSNGSVTIDGKPTNRYTVERDYIFAMGDNRDNSLDSRFWGFVPVDDVVGTPMIVYWSWDPSVPIFDIITKLQSIQWGRLGTIIN